jgi:hypothetical protein
MSESRILNPDFKNISFRSIDSLLLKRSEFVFEGSIARTPNPVNRGTVHAKETEFQSHIADEGASLAEWQPKVKSEFHHEGTKITDTMPSIFVLL